MNLNCWNCKTIITLDTAAVTAAIQKMDDTKLGFFDVACTKCGKKNRTQRGIFAAALAGAKAAESKVAAAPVAVAAAPAPSSAARKAKVIVASLRVREEHNTDCEIVAGLVRDQEVEVFETWTDGKNTWARIGEGTWAAVQWNDQKMLELLS